MNVQKSELINEWTSEILDERINERLAKWQNEFIKLWKDQKKKRKTNESMKDRPRDNEFIKLRWNNRKNRMGWTNLEWMNESINNRKKYCIYEWMTKTGQWLYDRLVDWLPATIKQLSTIIL